MNKNFLLLIIFAFLSPMAADAQTSYELVADIPFNFSVCAESMLAGRYKVRPLSNANPRIMLARSDDGRSVIMSCAHDVEIGKLTTTGKLIFNRYGDQYFLSELWLQGEKIGSQLVKSEQEEALLREVKRAKHEKVTIKVTEVKP